MLGGGVLDALNLELQFLPREAVLALKRSSMFRDLVMRCCYAVHRS